MASTFKAKIQIAFVLENKTLIKQTLTNGIWLRNDIQNL
jgi:hypothetical protein